MHEDTQSITHSHLQHKTYNIFQPIDERIDVLTDHHILLFQKFIKQANPEDDIERRIECWKYILCDWMIIVARC